MKRTEAIFAEPEDSDFADAYAFMADQVALRTGIRSSGGMLWAWYAAQGESRRRPDLRSRGWHHPGERAVLAELLVPAQLVVLSQFELWHWVLNKWSMYVSVEPDTDTCRCRAIFDSNNPSAHTADPRTRVFDLAEGCSDCFRPHADRQIQATVPYFRREWIVSEREFTAR